MSKSTSMAALSSSFCKENFIKAGSVSTRRTIFFKVSFNVRVLPSIGGVSSTTLAALSFGLNLAWSMLRLTKAWKDCRFAVFFYQTGAQYSRVGTNSVLYKVVSLFGTDIICLYNEFAALSICSCNGLPPVPCDL